jgi:hypothetical protein
MKILVGMEYSGRFRNALRDLGHEAYSCCDLPSEDNSPYHHVGNVLNHLEDGWDAAIFHPTCRYFTLSGIRWMYHPEDSHLEPEQRRRHPKYPNRMLDLQAQVQVFRALQQCSIPIKAIENSQPHGLAMQHIGKYTQKVQPWWFGDPYTKAACWWLTNLPKLMPTNIVPKELRIDKCHMIGPGAQREIERSRTEPELAKAAALQWFGKVK